MIVCHSQARCPAPSDDASTASAWQLDESEANALLSPLCANAQLVRDRGAAPLAIAEALLLGAPYELGEFLRALEGESAQAAYPAAAAATGVRGRMLSPAELGALAHAYLTMAPASTLQPKGTHDEL